MKFLYQNNCSIKRFTHLFHASYHFSARTAFTLLLLMLLQACANDDTLEPEQPATVDAEETRALIYEWNTLWLHLDHYTNAMRPNTTARALAYIHLTAYETAVASMEGYRSNQERLDELQLDETLRQPNVDLGVALNTAYASVMTHFMFGVAPDVASEIATLQAEKEAELSAGLSTAQIENSIAWGSHVAAQVIAYSQTDEAAEAQIIDPSPEAYVPPVGEGLWIAAEGERAWFPYWRDVRSFVISGAETTSIPPPFPYDSNPGSDYYAAMETVNVITTTASEENNENLWIAEFWSDDVEGLMMSPPGRQFSIATQLAVQEELGYAEILALFLKLGFAMNDAAVSAWDDKYTYNTQRPSTYITEYINADFQTNLARFISSPNPAFPSYPSGHATFAGAAAGIFKAHFGGDLMSLTDRTYEGRTDFKGVPRDFESFTELAAENAFSRVPLGVHIQADSDEGLRLGYEIAAAINALNISN